MQILVIGATLILFGLLAIYSVSIHESFTLTLKLINSGIMSGDPSNYFYFGRQITNILIALATGLFTMFIPLKFFQKQKNIIIISILIFLLQLLVFVPGIGIELNGARGWINIPILPSAQPAEFFKIGYVIFLAGWLIRKKDLLESKDILIKFIIINIIVLGVFFLIPDLGTIVILGLVGIIMLRYAGAKTKHIMLLMFSGIIGGLLLGGLAGMISSKFSYIQKRFTYFLSKDIDPQNTSIGRQNQQALIAIGGGGFFGQGYGKGLQKFGYIPEAQSDFIFSAFSEEIGFIGNMILLFLYFYLCFYFLKNLYKVKDPYLRTFGVGIISLIIIQMFVNIGVNLKIMPNTGLTLPFISYGGTALMINVIEIIFLYKILQSGKDSFHR